MTDQESPALPESGGEMSEEGWSGYVGRCKFCGYVGRLDDEMIHSNGRTICADSAACDARWLLSRTPGEER